MSWEALVRPDRVYLCERELPSQTKESLRRGQVSPKITLPDPMPDLKEPMLDIRGPTPGLRRRILWPRGPFHTWKALSGLIVLLFARMGGLGQCFLLFIGVADR